MSQFHHNFIATIIDRYGLELDGHQVDITIADWLQKYDRTWIVKAIVESLYRGRYKIKSIDNILRDWQRLGKPRYNFTPEYEREILQNLPDLNDTASTSSPTEIVSQDPLLAESIEPNLLTIQAPIDSKDLDPEQSAPFQYHNYSRSTVPPPRSHLIVAGEAATDGLEADSLVDLHIDDRNDADPTVVPSSSVIYPQSCSHNDRDRAARTDRIISLPAKLQLFKTLKAIVEPQQLQRQESSSRSICPPLSAEHHNYARVAQFQLPIETMSEERQL
jgi:hypothetical protein